jgi:hypothetical protein
MGDYFYKQEPVLEAETALVLRVWPKVIFEYFLGNSTEVASDRRIQASRRRSLPVKSAQT